MNMLTVSSEAVLVSILVSLLRRCLIFDLRFVEGLEFLEFLSVVILLVLMNNGLLNVMIFLTVFVCGVCWVDVSCLALRFVCVCDFM